MQQSPLMLWRFVLMLICIRRSKDLLEQFQEFECSSLFAFNFCVYRTTRYNKCSRIGTKWLFFFTFTEECCVVIEKNIGKKLPNRIIDQAWYKRCLKGTFGRGGGSKSAKGVQICEGGSISASWFGPGGSKSAVTPAFQERNQGLNTQSHSNLCFAWIKLTFLKVKILIKM